MDGKLGYDFLPIQPLISGDGGVEENLFRTCLVAMLACM